MDRLVLPIPGGREFLSNATHHAIAKLKSYTLEFVQSQEFSRLQSCPADMGAQGTIDS